MASSCDGVDPAPLWVPSGSQRSLGALKNVDIRSPGGKGTVTASHGPACPTYIVLYTKAGLGHFQPWSWEPLHYLPVGSRYVTYGAVTLLTRREPLRFLTVELPAVHAVSRGVGISAPPNASVGEGARAL